MKRLLLLLISIAASIGLFGCAAPTNMAFKSDSDKLSEKVMPIYLLSVTLKNSYKPNYQPVLKNVFLTRPSSTGKLDVIRFPMDDRGVIESDTPDVPTRYLVRLELEPGSYQVQRLHSLAGRFPVSGFFNTPVTSSISASEPGIFYLGNIDANVRERQGDEFRAGPVIPLIDQAVTGASGGTFDVAISDQFATDEALFRKTFTQLKDAPIRKSILPPFDRAKAQKDWGGN